MTIRIDVLPDSTIEIMRPHRIKEHNVFHKGLDLDTAMILIRYYAQRDLEASSKNRFVSQAKKEARRAFKQLSERSPYHDKKER
jgi:hypothetical protein